MENVAQGRVWTGKAASTRGLVDTIGGFSKAVAIAKKKAGIPESSKVGTTYVFIHSPWEEKELRDG